MKFEILKYSFVILLFTLSLGFYCNSWFSLIAWATFLSFSLSGKLTENKKKWTLAIILSSSALLSSFLMKTPLMVEQANVFIGGQKYDNSVFAKNLPSEVYNHLNEEFIFSFPKSISAPDKKLFDYPVENIFSSDNTKKKLESIKWKNRYQLELGAFNDGNYNAWGTQEPARNNLPFFVKYMIPKILANNPETKICWKGKLFKLNSEGSLQISYNYEKACEYTNKLYFSDNDLILWLVESSRKDPLNFEVVLPIKYEILHAVKILIKLICCYGIIFLLFENINYRKSSFIFFSFLFSLLLMYLHSPLIINKFLLFEGGNDGLTYAHFAHIITDKIIEKDFWSALEGGEPIYDLMPWYRYIWVLNYFLFGEAPWIPVITVSLLPFTMYSLLKNLVGKKWSFNLIILWLFIPVFESFGFFHYYYAKLSVRGFAEPLSYLAFFTATSLFVNVVNKESYILNKKQVNPELFFLMGLLFSFSIGIRANIALGAIVLIALLTLFIISKINWKMIIPLFLGASTITLVPIHNYVFGNKFVPLTIAAYKDWNLGTKPSDYFNLIKSIFIFDFDTYTLNKIIAHLGGEIKIYEIWYHMSLIITIYMAINTKTKYSIRAIALAAISLQTMTLFYHVGGRYGYLTWTLTLIVFLVWVKEYFLPKLQGAKKIEN